MRGKWTMLTGALLLAGVAPAQTTAPTATAPAEAAAIAKAVAPSLVKVECTLQFDKGEPPRAHGWGYRCANCGQFHNLSGEDAVREERPAESCGFLVEPTKVIAPDPMVHPRFVKSVAVRFGQQVVPAKVAGYIKDQQALLLELAEPLKQARPLTFDAARKGPCEVVTYSRANAVWTIAVQSMPSTVSTTETGRKFLDVPTNCLIVDKSGGPVGLCMKEALPLDDSWKVSPLKWPSVSAADMAKALAALQEKADKCLLRVKLDFRSPKKGERSEFRGEEEGSVTEMNVLGVLLESRQVLVLAQLKPNVTARLEHVTVYPAKGEGVPGKFAGTLTDYGALSATLEKPLEGPAVLSPADILQYQTTMLLSAQVRLRGETREAYFDHRRIAAFELGWKQHLYPSIAGDEQDTFLFDEQGRLLVLPIVRREKVSGEGDRSYGGERGQATAAAYLKDILTDLAKNTDPSNVPLTEEQESRLAWMGVELQPLNRELARANNVSDQTQEGRTGALVSYVYPGSPADKKGIKAGFVLLRLHAADVPKPIEVTIREFGFSDRPFPWDRLDQLPEKYYDQIPAPWPPAENNFTRTLTDLGFGKKYTAEFYHEGKTIREDFDVVESPAHYETAPKYKAPAVGLTVRDLTYEVRRYFQKTADDPGVIVSKIEPGSKASVAGVKPYELVTHVNDKPVLTVKDFERLIDKQDNLRLSVLRMTKGRIVPINVTGPTSKPEPTTKPGGAQPRPEDELE